MSLFKLHQEKRIGYKRLSDADLGLSGKSHQTHLGLYDDILTFLPNSVEISDAIFIYGDEYNYVDVLFDRIMNPDGTYRSPKIRKGMKCALSLLSIIRKHAKNTLMKSDWYLFWFGLDNEQPVFYLVRRGSDDYQKLLDIGIDLSSSIRGGRLTEEDYQFDSLLSFLETKINMIRRNEAKELELLVLSDAVPDYSKHRVMDYAEARRLCTEVGRRGEEIINQYMEGLLAEGKISSFVWMNEEFESYCPYDFEYVTSDTSSKSFIEVKTTGYSFEQNMIFSGQEIKFGNEHINCYDIFRIYRSPDGRYFMRICENVEKIFENLNKELILFKDKTIPYACVESIKLSVNPLNDDLKFGEEKRLIYSLD